jgi:hypothetical protein
LFLYAFFHHWFEIRLWNGANRSYQLFD